MYATPYLGIEMVDGEALECRRGVHEHVAAAAEIGDPLGGARLVGVCRIPVDVAGPVKDGARVAVILKAVDDCAAGGAGSAYDNRHGAHGLRIG